MAGRSVVERCAVAVLVVGLAVEAGGAPQTRVVRQLTLTQQRDAPQEVANAVTWNVSERTGVAPEGWQEGLGQVGYRNREGDNSSGSSGSSGSSSSSSSSSSGSSDGRRRRLGETNEATKPCAGTIQGSPDAALCCKRLGDDETQCKAADGVCEWFAGDTKEGADQRGECLALEDDTPISPGVWILLVGMVVVVIVPTIYKCCCSAKQAKRSTVSFEPDHIGLPPDLSSSTQTYWAAQNE